MSDHFDASGVALSTGSRARSAEVNAIAQAIETALTALEAEIDAAFAAVMVGSGCPVSANDGNPGYLNGKLVVGDGIEFVENNDGGNETMTISAADLEGKAFFMAIAF